MYKTKFATSVCLLSVGTEHLSTFDTFHMNTDIREGFHGQHLHLQSDIHPSFLPLSMQIPFHPCKCFPENGIVVLFLYYTGMGSGKQDLRMLCYISTYICSVAQNFSSSHLALACFLGRGDGEAVLRGGEDAVESRQLIFKSGTNILFHWRQNLLSGQA